MTTGKTQLLMVFSVSVSFFSRGWVDAAKMGVLRGKMPFWVPVRAVWGEVS